MRIAFLIMITMLFSVTAKADSYLYVKSSYARLRSKPGIVGKNDKKLLRGARLKKLRYAKKWYFVAFSTTAGEKIQGWIYKGYTSRRRPMQNKFAGDERIVPAQPIAQHIPHVIYGKPIQAKHRHYLQYHKQQNVTEKMMLNFLLDAQIGPFAKRGDK